MATAQDILNMVKFKQQLEEQRNAEAALRERQKLEQQNQNKSGLAKTAVPLGMKTVNTINKIVSPNNNGALNKFGNTMFGDTSKYVGSGLNMLGNLSNGVSTGTNAVKDAINGATNIYGTLGNMTNNIGTASDAINGGINGANALNILGNSSNTGSAISNAINGASETGSTISNAVNNVANSTNGLASASKALSGAGKAAGAVGSAVSLGSDAFDIAKNGFNAKNAVDTGLDSLSAIASFFGPIGWAVSGASQIGKMIADATISDGQKSSPDVPSMPQDEDFSQNAINNISNTTNSVNNALNTAIQNEAPLNLPQGDVMETEIETQPSVAQDIFSKIKEGYQDNTLNDFSLANLQNDPSKSGWTRFGEALGTAQRLAGNPYLQGLVYAGIDKAMGNSTGKAIQNGIAWSQNKSKSDYYDKLMGRSPSVLGGTTKDDYSAALKGYYDNLNYNLNVNKFLNSALNDERNYNLNVDKFDFDKEYKNKNLGLAIQKYLEAVRHNKSTEGIGWTNANTNIKNSNTRAKESEARIEYYKNNKGKADTKVALQFRDMLKDAEEAIKEGKPGLILESDNETRVITPQDIIDQAYQQGIDLGKVPFYSEDNN